METKLYLQMLRKGWWIILLTVLVAVNATLIYSLVVTPRYQASTKLLVSPGAPMLVNGQQTINSLDTLDKRSVVATYAEFLNSDKAYLEAIQSLGLDRSQLADYTRTTIILPDARVLQVTVEGPDAKIVAAIANALAEKGVNYIRKFYQVYDINPIDLATVPTVPISPNPIRDVLLAFVFGLILGSALAILSEQIRIPFESLKQSRYMDNDSLAFNRRHFDRMLELEMMRCRAKGDVFSLGLVRLDGMADYIDNVPQLLLQKILQGVTKTLKQDLKGTDIVGRWNDTTFAIILPSTPYNAANALIGRLRTKLSEPVAIGDGEESIRLEPYVGVARSKDNEVIEDFVVRVQKDLDEDMFNVPVPPPPAGKPATQATVLAPAPSAPSVPAAAPAQPSAASRLATLFASAPQNSPVPPAKPSESVIPPSAVPPAAPVYPTSANRVPDSSLDLPPFSAYPPSRGADPYLPDFNESPASAAYPPVSPFTTPRPAVPFTQPPAAPQAQPSASHPYPSSPRNPTPQEDIKVRSGLYKGDILDFDSPPSELSQGIDDDLTEMRKHWKIN